MPESYGNFAQVYDTFMDDTDYEAWTDRVIRMRDRYGLPAEQTGAGTVEEAAFTAETDPAQGTLDPAAQERQLICDIGCGTGRVTEILASRGYDVMGIDLSPDMLAIAQERSRSAGRDTLYLCQDMRELDLYGDCGTFISVGDSLNYLLSEEDLLKTFQRVALFLLQGGVFIFDSKTPHLFRDVIGDQTIAEDREDCAFIWDNTYDDETGINEYDLALYIQEEQDLFRKYEEVHYQRGYEPAQLRRIAEAAGLTWLEAVDCDTDGPVTEETVRYLAVVRK